ncbi:MAG: response regulator [Phaeodactylibacter sp.]|nr:response regulator [Phaeodactylibacter sp.]MCB9301142.1 response regulator [Lewinellaceae bacterium]
MIRAILVEDETDSLDYLEWLIHQVSEDVEVVARCHSGLEGLEAIPRLQPDVVFLDVDMPFMNGFEMLEALPDMNFRLIFTTAYDEFAIRAFKLSAAHYLLKPIQAKDLADALSRVRQVSVASDTSTRLLLEQTQALSQGSIEKIALPTFDGFTLVHIKDIVYCHADSNYTDLFFKTQEKLCVTRTLGAMEDALEGLGFMRVHHSFLVNIREIAKFIRHQDGLLIMSNGDEVRVSRSRKQELLDYLARISV